MLLGILYRVTYVRVIRGAGTTGAGEELSLLPKQCGGSTGATGCRFYRKCTSTFVRYLQDRNL